MKKFLLAATFFAGCTVSSPQSIRSDQVYQGYPCGQACPAFQRGFDQAKQEQLQTDLDCAAYPIDQLIGCQAAVVENVRGRDDYSDFSLK
jgi:hypothetical protein